MNLYTNLQLALVINKSLFFVLNITIYKTHSPSIFKIIIFRLVIRFSLVRYNNCNQHIFDNIYAVEFVRMLRELIKKNYLNLLNIPLTNL